MSEICQILLLKVFVCSGTSILQPYIFILRPALVIRLSGLVPKCRFCLLLTLCFKTTCHIRPYLQGPIGGLKAEGALYIVSWCTWYRYIDSDHEQKQNFWIIINEIMKVPSLMLVCLCFFFFFLEFAGAMPCWWPRYRD